ncbi:MAG: VWA domain-containing protein [Eubacteriales bacterium]|nr:VWA domain-containing protein [Eubacteriales bacterium]
MSYSEEPIFKPEIVKRKLHLFWLVDCSGSMQGKKISTLNYAIRDVVPEIQQIAKEHPEIQMYLRTIKFSDKAAWVGDNTPVSVESFVWIDLTSGGLTSAADAINLLCEELEMEKMGRRGLPPVCIFISDGYYTNSTEEYQSSIDRLNKLPWGKKAIRLVIGIGQDGSDYDAEELLKFSNHKEIGVLEANTAKQLTEYIKWASTAASLSSIESKSRQIDDSSGVTDSSEGQNVVILAPPDIPIDDDVI